MEAFEILLAIAIIGLGLKATGLALKGLKITPQQSVFLICVLVFIGGWTYNWFGIRDMIQPAVVVEEPTVPTFNVTGSETSANLIYNSDTRTFTMKIRENTTAGKIQIWNYDTDKWDALTTEPTVTLSLTLIRTDTDPNSQIGTVSIGVIPTFVEGGVTYSVINETADDKWKVEITPAGEAAQWETASALVAGAGTKKFDLKWYFSNAGVSKASTGIQTCTFSGGPPGVDVKLSVSVEPDGR